MNDDERDYEEEAANRRLMEESDPDPVVNACAPPPVFPSVGRIVHYTSYGTPGGEFASECRAAVVTEVDPEGSYRVGLAVLNPTGSFFNRRVPIGGAGDGGTWHWPERI